MKRKIYLGLALMAAVSVAGQMFNVDSYINVCISPSIITK